MFSVAEYYFICAPYTVPVVSQAVCTVRLNFPIYDAPLCNCIRSPFGIHFEKNNTSYTSVRG